MGDATHDVGKFAPIRCRLVGCYRTCGHIYGDGFVYSAECIRITNRRRCCGFASDGGEAAAITESPVSNTRHALGDGDGGEAAATRESIDSNARHALGDDGR